VKPSSNYLFAYNSNLYVVVLALSIDQLKVALVRHVVVERIRVNDTPLRGIGCVLYCTGRAPVVAYTRRICIRVEYYSIPNTYQIHYV
jgi:hypothetical protein